MVLTITHFADASWLMRLLSWMWFRQVGFAYLTAIAPSGANPAAPPAWATLAASVSGVVGHREIPYRA
jgi:hypothetical protein